MRVGVVLDTENFTLAWVTDGHDRDVVAVSMEGHRPVATSTSSTQPTSVDEGDASTVTNEYLKDSREVANDFF